MKKLQQQLKTFSHHKFFPQIVAVSAVLLYGALLLNQGMISAFGTYLPIPNLGAARPKHYLEAEQPNSLHNITLASVEERRLEVISDRRQEQIDKVRRFFIRYGSPLVGYEDIFVDKSEQCGGDYRVLVGIAGSESGLGRINYMKYNPFGYLNGVQYSNQKEALEKLSCLVSTHHISVCKTDLQCLVRRYAGPGDDAQHFVNKVRWFMQQVS